jgi:hypothetical protein
MKDLTNPNSIKLKGILFLLCGLAASLILFLDQPSLRAAVLLSLAIWCFCRSYYFAFYVIQHYIDPTYRFSGLWSCAGYLLSRRGNHSQDSPKTPGAGDTDETSG